MNLKIKKISILDTLSWILGFVLGFIPTGLIPGVIGISPLILLLMIGLKLLSLGSSRNFQIRRYEASFISMLLICLLLIYLGFTLASLKYYNFNAFNYFSVNFQYLYSMLIFPLVIYLVFYSKSNIIIKGYITGIIFLMIFSYLVYLLLGYDGARALDWVQTNGRLTLWMGANTLCMHFVLGILIVLIQVIDIDARYKFLKIAFYFLFMLIPVMLTGSIGGLLILFLSSSFLVFLRFPKLSLLNLPIIFAAITLLGYYLLNYTDIQTVQRYVALFSGDIQAVGSYSDRQEGILLGFEIISQDSYIGVGAGEAYGVMNQMVGFKTIPHNSLVMLWLEGGILALLGGILWFLFFLGWVLINFKSRQIIYIFSILFAIALYWMTRTLAYQIFLYAPLFILLSLYNSKNTNINKISKLNLST
tara:strand:+ start:93406 stop:94659 length:1254 start_codon:yes stop_codon:yes gene_type:complete